MATSIEAEPGPSIMEILRQEGFSDVLALCGGCASCGTCHVIVEEAPAEALPPMSDSENALLDGFDHRTESSRLSCQIPLTQTLDGMCVRIPPEEDS